MNVRVTATLSVDPKRISVPGPNREELQLSADVRFDIDETLEAIAGLDPGSAGRVRLNGLVAATVARLICKLAEHIELDRSRILMTHTGGPDVPDRVCTFCTLKKENAGIEFAQLPRAVSIVYKGDGEACFACESCRIQNRKTHTLSEPLADFFKRILATTVDQALEKPT